MSLASFRVPTSAPGSGILYVPWALNKPGLVWRVCWVEKTRSQQPNKNRSSMARMGWSISKLGDDFYVIDMVVDPVIYRVLAKIPGGKLL